MTLQATQEELATYQYLLARARRNLEKVHIVLNRRREIADASSKRREELSAHSRTR
jgi:multidrug resistance efflux pump